MDSALILRLAMEKGESLSETEIDGLLNQSLLVAKLTCDNSSERLANIFKLVGLSEIPGSQRLRGTQQIVKFINQEVATSEGFAYTGALLQRDVVRSLCSFGNGPKSRSCSRVKLDKKVSTFGTGKGFVS